MPLLQAPNFYEPTPPAPPGLLWWRYKDNVPALPQPQAVLGPSYADYGWRYDADYQYTAYKFSNMDMVRRHSIGCLLLCL